MGTVLRNFFNNNMIIPSEESLQKELEYYKGILSKELYDYFEKILHCEVSVFYDNSFMNRRLREEISGLGIYKKLAIYNIYRHAFHVFNQENYRCMIDINGNLKGVEGLQVEFRKNDKVYPLFLYDYSMTHNVYDRISVPDGYKNIRIGDVDLYLDNVNADSVMRDTIISNINDKIRSLSFDNGYNINGSYLKPYYVWTYQHKDETNYYHNLLNKIKNCENDDKVNELQEYFCYLFLEKYGLDSDDKFDKDELDGNVRTLTRQYPGGSVRKHIRYI